ncbi:hypothetical protein PR048_013504 [Dryococelus australis]|uniref:Uncharacterized protein n=1 Tax=Dryococelus australis TaxID=614101 RepID=A0ABQ9HT71_9NEOP|nr:hypothetical protein PR048_013504 [Dryococelus australis]
MMFGRKPRSMQTFSTTHNRKEQGTDRTRLKARQIKQQTYYNKWKRYSKPLRGSKEYNFKEKIWLTDDKERKPEQYRRVTTGEEFKGWDHQSWGFRHVQKQAELQKQKLEMSNQASVGPTETALVTRSGRLCSRPQNLRDYET